MTLNIPVTGPMADAKASPDDLAMNALGHMGAALNVLELHAERVHSPEVLAARDLLRGYHAHAYQHTGWPQKGGSMGMALHSMSLDLDNAIAIVERLHADGADEPLLYAVNYLLLSAKRFADGGGAIPRLPQRTRRPRAHEHP